MPKLWPRQNIAPIAVRLAVLILGLCVSSTYAGRYTQGIQRLEGPGGHCVEARQHSDPRQDMATASALIQENGDNKGQPAEKGTLQYSDDSRHDAFSQNGVPLGDYLNPDGTLALPMEGIQGGIDPTGFEIVSGPGEAPRFEATEGQADLLAAGDERWDLQFALRGVNDSVRALAWDGTSLYVGGNFKLAGGVATDYIAKWDGNSWSPLGSGMNSNVLALVWDGTNLYAGGYFTIAGGVTANRIAKWDGNAWSPLGSGMYAAGSSRVYALAWDGTNLYAGGVFTAAGGISANNIAKWDGSVWNALGSGMNSDVNSLAWDGTNLYAGGAFTTAGGAPANYIAKWDGSVWSALGAGMDSRVSALAWDGSNLFAGGNFNMAGGIPAYGIAKWDGSAWCALGSGVDGFIGAIVCDGTTLYAGGGFSLAGGNTANNIAAWDGSAWSALGAGTNSMGGLGNVYALAAEGFHLYAGGDFTGAGDVVVSRMADWDGMDWSAMPDYGDGMTSYIHALAFGGASLNVGGYFTTAGDLFANQIAKWDGGSWSPLESGMSGGVLALAWDGTNLYAGGYFPDAGEVHADHIAKWDGSSWGALGSGMNGAVCALAWDGTNLYAGGDFTNAGGVSANRIARWDGYSWSPLGSGLNGTVYALAWSGTNLFAGGSFTTAGGMPSNYIAKWDGNSWSPLGPGMNNSVYALAWSGTILYVGGQFTAAGGMIADRIAKWDGSAWSPLGSGMSHTVYALAWGGAFLYAGGDFSTAGGTTANRIARWNGMVWSPLGSGTNGRVRALAIDGISLYAGGDFTTAGGKGSSYIGRWDIPPCFTPSVIMPILAADADACAYTGVQVTWPADAADWGDAGTGTRTYDVLRDGVEICHGLAYGSNLYTDTTGVNGTTYSYSVRYNNGCALWTATAGVNAADMNQTPGVPIITGISDLDPCAQNGIIIFFSGGAGAVRFDLVRDGLIVASGISSPVQYDPKNRANHTYAVRAVGESCLTDSSPLVFADAKNTPNPTIPPPYRNICPETAVTLSTEAGMSSYQWRLMGRDIPGATGQTYTATVSGKYSVAVVSAEGCSGESSEYRVKVVFCRDSAVSPTNCVYPLRVAKDASSPTGAYLYFQMIEGASGYNLYAGDIGSWYTHGITLERRVCDMVAMDLNTGEMQAPLPINPWDSYYLVTGFDSSYEGPSGFDSMGLEIPASQSTCAP